MQSPQADDQIVLSDTGTLKFAEPADHKGDKFHPSALKQSFAAEDPYSVKIMAGKMLHLTLWDVTKLICKCSCFSVSPQSLFVSFSQGEKKKNCLPR